LINRTLTAWNAALKNSGVSDAAISTVGGYAFVAYLIGACFEWFAPWSCVASFRNYLNSLDVAFYNACGGNNPLGTYLGAPLPAALAINLSLLVPCYDAVRNRTYYPVLIMDCAPNSFTVTGTGWVFSATGTAPWTSYYTTQAPSYFDTAGTTQAVLTKYASAYPVRTFPKMTPGLSLACSQVIALNAGTSMSVMTSHRPSQEEMELYGVFVLPRLYPNTKNGFLMLSDYVDALYWTPVLNYANVQSFGYFAILNNNMLSSAAKDILEEYDKLQESASGAMGWISTGLVTGAAAALGRYSKAISNGAVNAATMSLMYMTSRGSRSSNLPRYRSD